MRRPSPSFRKEKAIMLASSCLVLTALTVTGLYVRERRQDAPQDNVVDFTALEEEESLTMLGSQAGEQAADDEHFARYEDAPRSGGGFVNSLAFGLILTGLGLAFGLLFILLYGIHS